MKDEKDTKEAVKRLGVQLVATEAGVHYQTMYRWLRDRLSPTLRTYRLICNAIERLENER